MKNPAINQKRNWGHLTGWILVGILLASMAYYAGPAIMDNYSTPLRLVVYAFSTQEEVFTQGIFPSFEHTWESETGVDLSIEGVFGPSGTLAGQINLGAPADIAILSNANHVNWLKLGRLVQKDSKPITIGATPIVIVTRLGNPMGITEWSDLGKPGMQLLHEDPRSSGLGEWAILAEYGSAYLENGDIAEARAQLKAIWRNVRLMAPSARSALTLFEMGASDAFLTYEQDARLAMERGVQLEFVIPSRTIVVRPVAIIIEDNVKRSEAEMVQAFMDFLVSQEGQKIFSQYHLRPVTLEAETFPQLEQPFTEDDLGGWTWAYSELVEQFWLKEIEPRLDLETMPELLNPGN